MIVPLFAADALASRAEAWLEVQQEPCLAGGSARLGLAAAVARKHRTRVLSRADTMLELERFEHWSSIIAERVVMVPDDLAQARDWIGRLRLTPRAPDAIHLAMAARIGATLVTLDAGMAATRALSLPVAPA